jgi:cystathionine beta-lyase
MDFGAMLKAEEMKPFMQEKCSLAFDYGDWFGGERFATHIRMNLATSEELVQEAVSRILRNLPR